MKEEELPEEIKKDIEDELQREHLSEIKVGSYWGAVSSFLVLQVFGFFIYQAFRFYGLSLSILFPGFFLIFFLYIQAGILRKIHEFLSRNNFPGIATIFSKNIPKLLFGLIALTTWIFFNVGYYPFPKPANGGFISGLLFQICSWIISWIISNKNNIKHVYISELRVTSGCRRFVGIVFSLLLFLISLQRPEYFYIFSMIPLGTLFVLLVSWMLE